MIIYREAQGKGWISSASSVASSTAKDDGNIRIGRFTDIQFASDMSYSQTAGTRTLEFASKQDSFGQVTVDVNVDVDADEAKRDRREEIELQVL